MEDGGIAEFVDEKMFSASGCVFIPESITDEAFHFMVLFRFFGADDDCFPVHFDKILSSCSASFRGSSAVS